MVAGEALPIQWQSHGSQNNNCDHQITWMGSCVRWHQDRWTLHGATWIEQEMHINCLGVRTGSNPGSQNLLEGSSRGFSVVTFGQIDSYSIHQQHVGQFPPN